MLKVIRNAVIGSVVSVTALGILEGLKVKERIAAYVEKLSEEKD